MAILYRPAKVTWFKKYNQEPYNGEIEERSNLFLEKMPANIAAGAMVFFLSLRRKLK